MPCPVQPGGSGAFVGATATGLGGCSVPQAPALQVVSCPVSPADTGSQEKFALPGRSPVRDSMTVASSPPPRRLWQRAGLGRAASSHGSPQCQCRGVPEVGWEQHVPAKRVGRGWSVSWPATPTPSHPYGATLCSSSVLLPTPARNPALALPGRLQVWGKPLPVSTGSAALPCRQGWCTRSITAEKCQISGTTSVLQTAAKATWGESWPGRSRARSMGHGPTAAGFVDDETLTHLFF